MLKISQNIKTVLGTVMLTMLSSCAAQRITNNLTTAREQAKIDSLYYRTLFNQTQAANDNNAVAEFNKIAAQMSSLNAVKRKDLSHEIIKNGEIMGITDYEKGLIRAVKYISNKEAIQAKQKFADKFVYERFFKKYGIADKLK